MISSIVEIFKSLYRLLLVTNHGALHRYLSVFDSNLLWISRIGFLLVLYLVSKTINVVSRSIKSCRDKFQRDICP